MTVIKTIFTILQCSVSLKRSFHMRETIKHVKLTPTSAVLAPKKIITEDLGKIFEMSVCMLYETEYHGKYKYSLEEAEHLKNKMQGLKTVFPYEIKHIAKNGNKYDFVSIDEPTIYLSAKTTKKTGMVCPQVIGQSSKKKFCDFFQIDNDVSPEFCDTEKIKKYIEENIKLLLEAYAHNTFDCPVVYYNKNKNTLLFVKLKENINWTDHIIKFSHISKNKQWNESTSIMIDNNTIGEFQIHNHRDCIKFRWSFEKLLKLFKNNFEITNL